MDIAEQVVATRAGAGEPATHILIIGVSQYRHLIGGPDENDTGRAWEMGQLTAAAGSATEVAAWLATRYHNPSAPIGSLRVLVSPTEHDTLDPLIAQHVQTDAHRATRANVGRALREFKAAVEQSVDNVAIVYVAGHGVQTTKHESTVLLEDIGDPTHETSLQGAVDMVGCYNGLDHEAAARAQFWFVDACRQRPAIADRFERMNGAFTFDRPHTRADGSVCFLSASTREASFARPGGRTLFAEALLEAVRGGAMRKPTDSVSSWHISAYSLHEFLRGQVAAAARAAGEKQTVYPLGGSDALFHVCPTTPRVGLTVSLDPAAAGDHTSARIHNTTAAGWPFEVELDAGLYILKLDATPPFESNEFPIDITPPSSKFLARVRKRSGA